MREESPGQTAAPGLAAALSSDGAASSSVVDLGVTVSNKMKLLTAVQDSLKSTGSGVTASQGAAYLCKAAGFGSL